MNGRLPLVVAIVLGMLLVAGGAAAWGTGGRPVVAGPPAGSPLTVPRSGAGSDVVLLSADALAHPHARVVRDQLQRHYRAINARDYVAWSDTVVPERSTALPEARWLDAYASTTDGTIRIDRVDEVPGGGLLVRVRFVSTQDMADAPPEFPAERICWRSTVPMTAPAPGAPPRIGLTGSGSSIAAVCPPVP